MENEIENETTETPTPVQEPEIDYSSVDIPGLPELKEGESYKGMVPITEFAKLHPDIGKHYKNLQGAKTKAEQKAAQLEKELAALKSEYLGKQQATYQQIQNLEKELKNPDGSPKQYDTYTDEGYDSYIRAEAQKAFIEANKPFVEQYQKQQQAELHNQMVSFINGHQEFDDEIFYDTVLDKMEHHNLSIEEAYAICARNYKPKPTEQDKFQQTIQKSNQTIDNRNAIFSMGGPARVAKIKPDYSSAKKSQNPMEEIYRIQKELGIIKG